MPSLNTRRQPRGQISNRRKNTVRNNKKRSKSVDQRKKNTSEEIGSGGFGIVSRPAAKCDSFLNKNFNQNAWRAAYYNNPNYISKLTEYGSAARELEVALVIKDEIPNYDDYYCLVEFICNAPQSKSINRNGDFYGTYAISPYGGIPFSELLRQDIVAPMNVFELCYLLTALQQLVLGIRLLHIRHIFHKDIHDENILYDSENYMLRLIDFGLAENHSDIKNVDSPIIINSESHDLEMLLDNVIMPFIEYLLDSRISEAHIRNKHPAIDDFYYQIREFYGRITAIKNPRNQISYSRADPITRDTRLLNIIYQFKKLKGINDFINNTNNNNNNT